MAENTVQYRVEVVPALPASPPVPHCPVDRIREVCEKPTEKRLFPPSKGRTAEGEMRRLVMMERIESIMAKMLYQGHGSVRFKMNDGTVIYLDPYAGEGYDLPADYIFVTHEHHDHNEVDKMPHAPNCRVVTEKDAIRGGQHLTFNFTTFQVRAVEAYNSHHKKTECVGYIFLLDGKKVYCAGDTSTTAQMADMAKMNIDYALLPIDGVYNMGPAEAAKCAAMIGAAHVIPVHMAPGQLFDQQKAEQLDVPNRLILHPGEEIEL